MKTRGTGVVGYNVQTAVDTKHHLIVAHIVTNDGIDRDQLTSMAKLARTEMAVDKLTAVADRGYYSYCVIYSAGHCFDEWCKRCVSRSPSKMRNVVMESGTWRCARWTAACDVMRGKRRQRAFNEVFFIAAA
jgi:hypothetical protein